MKRKLIFTFCLVLSIVSFAQKDEMILVKNGNSDYVIVVAKNKKTKFYGDNEQVDYAARLLQSEIQKLTGCLIPILTDDKRAIRKEICINPSNRFDNYMMDFGYGYEVFTDKDKLFIYGNDDALIGEKGSSYTIYAVVDFLERHLGIRKFTPDCEVYPKKKDIILNKKDLNYSYASKNTFRQVQSRFTRDNSDFRYWLKQHLQEDMFAKGYFVHTFERLVPRGKYFETHPEYYSLINGKRMHDQLCLSNEEVFNIVVQRLKEEMEKQPLAKVWSVSQNDNFSYCSCSLCSKVNEREESPSGVLIEFVNKVAREFPNKTISTLAYQYSRKAPKHIKPEDNVQIMLCTIEEDRNKSIEDSGNDALKTNPNAQTFAKDIKDWAKITKNIFLWDYQVDFAYSVSPFPNIHTLKPNLEFFMKNNAFQHFQQANSDFGHEFAELKTYVLSKLLWNININQDSIINEFLNAYYGKASGYIREYIDVLEKKSIESKVFLDIYAPPTSYQNSFLSKENIELYVSIFNKAEKAVENDSVYLLRVRTARMPLWYAQMEIGKSDMFGQRGWYRVENGKYILREDMMQILEDFNQTAIISKTRNLNESNLLPKQYYDATKRFIDINVEDNLAFEKEIIANPQPSKLYSNGKISTLTNGVNGADDYKVHWLGWHGEDFSLILDLDTIIQNKNITLSSLYFPKSWILHPSKVECFVSKDSKNYHKVGEVEIGNIQKQEEIIREYNFSPKDIDYRYIKFEIKGTKTLPYWHPSEGGVSWVFLDEIIVK